jgi:citrate synthase
MFVILFTIPRTAGWIAHWVEFLKDKENKILRPRQNYQGYSNRNYVPIEQRTNSVNIDFFLSFFILKKNKKNLL